MLRLLGPLVFLASAPTLAASVVVGVTGVDDDHSAVVVVDLGVGGAAARTVADVAHRKGYAPKGVVVDDDTIALVLAQDDRAQGLLVAVDLKTGAEHDLLDEVMVEQRPARRLEAGAPRLTVVRGREHGAAGSSFDVVDVDVKTRQSQILASSQRLWITPVDSGDVAAVMVTEGGIGHRAVGAVDGAFHIDVVDDGALRPVVALGIGAFRSPVRFAGRWLVERSDRPGKSSSLVDDTGKVWLQGAPGLSPTLATASSSASLLATSSGQKSGGVIVWNAVGASRQLAGARAGIARPLALTVTDKGVVVVAWLDRGVSLPGELWAISEGGGVRLLEPQALTAISVYGVVDDVGAPKGVSP